MLGQLCKNILDQVSVPVLACDLSGRLLYLNHLAERLSGWALWEAVHQQLVDVLPIRCSDTGDVTPIEHAITSGEEVVSIPALLKTRYGQSLDIALDIAPLWEGQIRSGIVLVAHCEIPEEAPHFDREQETEDD